MTRDGEQRRHAGGIVVGAVKDPRVGRSEVIVVGRDDDRLCAGHGAIDPAEDVRGVGVLRLGRTGQDESLDAEVREGEGLEVLGLTSRSESDGLELTGDPLARLESAWRSGAAAPHL